MLVLLGEVLVLASGIPSADAGKQVAIDGKSIRGRCSGSNTTDMKSNEITAGMTEPFFGAMRITRDPVSTQA